jgi:capsular polysaccharide transport system permease protein
MKDTLIKAKNTLGALVPKKKKERVVSDIRGSLLTFDTYRWVLLSVFVVALYFMFMASDRYQSTASLFIKSAEADTAAIPGLQLISGNSAEQQDGSVLTTYIHSYAMLDYLDKKIKIGEHFSSSEWDILSRMESSPSRERFLDYYRSRISISSSLDSSLIEVRAQAFTPEFAKLILDEIIVEAERFVNEVGQRIAKDQISFIEGEVARAQDNISGLRDNILKFQNENNLLDPEASGIALQTAVNTLEAELIQLRATEKVQSGFLNDQAAELVATRARIDALEEQMELERAKLVSEDTTSLNETFAEFTQMKFDLDFAGQVYATTLAGAERARVEAYKKLKYLVVVSPAFLPEDAKYPRAIYNLITMFIALSLAYGIIVMIIATIREHRDV